MDEGSDPKPKRTIRQPQKDFPATTSEAAKRTAPASGSAKNKKSKGPPKPTNTSATFAQNPGDSIGHPTEDGELDEEGDFSQDEEQTLDPEGEILADSGNLFDEMPLSTQHKPVSLIASDRPTDNNTTQNVDTLIPSFDPNPIGHSGANTNARTSERTDTVSDSQPSRQSSRVSKQTQHFVTENSLNYAKGIIGRHQMSQGASAKRDRPIEIDDDSENEEGDDSESDNSGDRIVREPENVFPPGQNQSFDPNVYTSIYVPRYIGGAALPTHLPGIEKPAPLDSTREKIRREYNNGFDED